MIIGVFKQEDSQRSSRLTRLVVLRVSGSVATFGVPDGWLQSLWVRLFRRRAKFGSTRVRNLGHGRFPRLL